MELEEELRKMKSDVATITETKKKLKGTKELQHFIQFYSGVTQEKRAASGVAILINNKFRNRIHSYNFISDRIINLRIKIARGYLTFICVYAPEEGKKNESIEFYKLLKRHLDNVNKNDYLILGGDFNARPGNHSIKDVLGTNGKRVLNENGKMMINFTTFNALKITNTFFRHKDMHTYTWTNRGYRSIIDYILVNKKLFSNVNDTTAFRSYDINSNHFTSTSKINLPTRWYNAKRTSSSQRQQCFKTHLLYEDSIRRLYCKRLDLYMNNRAIGTDVNLEWKDLKEVILKAATEVLGKRYSGARKKGLKIWNDEIASLIKNKKEAFLKFLNTN
jgi:exonuclease III